MYSEKLKHPKWQRKRLEILQRDHFTCQACEDTETTLHVHHRRYEGENPWDTSDIELITLCKHCHWLVEKVVWGGLVPDKVIKENNLLVYLYDHDLDGEMVPAIGFAYYDSDEFLSFGTACFKRILHQLHGNLGLNLSHAENDNPIV